MNSKYQQYYNILNGKEFSSYVSNYSSALSDISAKVTSIETVISSSKEKGLDYIKSTTLPSLKSQTLGIEQGLKSLSTAASKCADLNTKLSELKSACDSYAACKDDDEDDEIHRSNKKEKLIYKNKISTLESQIDTLINEINAIAMESDPVTTTGTTSTTQSTATPGSIEAKREAFIGDVNDSSKYYVDPAYATRLKKLVCFDNTTGEILEDGDTFYMKPGETRVLTVRLPYNAGEIDKVLRTTADGSPDYRNYVTAKSDINPDPDVIDYVNYKNWSGHYPEGVDLHTNYYDWVITATADGKTHISQTCEYTNTNGNMPKAMIGINVVVSS